MLNDTPYLDITLLGKEYRVACPPEEKEALQSAANYVDGKMRDIAEKTRSNVAERIAVMAALNIAHEMLATKSDIPMPYLTNGSETALDISQAKARIQDMEARLDAVLKSQEELF